MGASSVFDAALCFRSISHHPHAGEHDPPACCSQLLIVRFLIKNELSETNIRAEISKTRKWIWLDFGIAAILCSILWAITGGYLEKVQTNDGIKYVLNGTSMVFLLIIVSTIINARVSYAKIELYETILKTLRKDET